MLPKPRSLEESPTTIVSRALSRVAVLPRSRWLAGATPALQAVLARRGVRHVPSLGGGRVVRGEAGRCSCNRHVGWNVE